MSSAERGESVGISQLLADSERPVFFSGAGISTESGIPDFRGPSGFWKDNKPIYFDDFISSEEMRRKSWERNVATKAKIASVQPNIAHHKIDINDPVRNKNASGFRPDERAWLTDWSS